MKLVARYALSLAVMALAVMLLAFESAQTAPAQEQGAASDVLSKDAVLRDPENPVLGNPQGDITIIEYFDYQCPYCKKISPVLDQVVNEDKKIRLIFKDWPILGEPSGYAARLVLAAKYQNKYEAAHRALMAKVGRLTEGVIDEALTKAGVDLAKAKADLAANKPAIDGLLKRNNAQAEEFGFRGTPAFVVGTFRVPGGLTAEQFKLAIADARKAAKNGAKGK
ncbi:protein-disulfide isomerase [Afipia massiliensis]|uniref:Protein-disulfide isomerase n=1 Tax=Afipia massiliensis TaxID=211460 RepID=A0A840N094_9BRAD|nr:DsbA family protein [Afipia massiliensis]MBB5052440.1 protein-disulfide isomerase [Afipia massiliensis]